MTPTDAHNLNKGRELNPSLHTDSNNLASGFVRLDDFSLILVDGDDATAFLQGQLSNDLDSLQVDQCQLHAYCNPKGRVIALPWLIQADQGYWMLVQKELAETFIKRLKMYVMRAKVAFNLDHGHSPIGLIGGQIGDFSNTDTATSLNQLSQSTNRTILICPDNGEIQNQYPTQYCINQWRVMDIVDGIPRIDSNTQEMFIPQNINLDLIEGISWSKGCYPGQEIVARLKYRGKSKQRMVSGWVETHAKIISSDPVYDRGKQDQGAKKVGNIVDAVQVSDNKYYLSASVKYSADTVLELDIIADKPYPITTLPHAYIISQ